MPGAHVAEIFNTLYHNWHWIVGFVTVLKVLVDTRRGGRFIATVLSGSDVDRRAAYWMMLKAFWQSKTLFLDFGARRLAAARFLTELEILLPDIPRPEAIDYPATEYETALAAWEQRTKRRRKIKAEVLDLYFGSRHLTVLRWLWRGLSTHVLRRPIEAPSHTDVIPIEDIRALDSSRHYIKRYFDVLEEVREEESKTFIAKAEFRTGNLAPLFLITGLINRFGDAEGWKLILDNYRQLVRDDANAYSPELVELRSFLFNCWLLWGPSISPCTCAEWVPPDHSDDLILQYGYGDENNSIDILIRNGARPEKVQAILQSFHPQGPARPGVTFQPLATMGVPYTVRGRFNWGPSLADAIPSAQALVHGGRLAPNAMNGRIVLECDAEYVQPNDVATASRYYSAYIWIMFRIETRTGASFFPESPWKDLLVFFEHGNVADASTFQTLKESLIVKACSALTEILQRPADRERLQIRYVCALDHANCGPHADIRFPPRDGLLAKGAAANEARATRLIEILAEKGPRLLPQGVLESGRLILPNSGFPEADNPHGSCHLPLLVEAFYADLRRPTPLPKATAKPRTREPVPV